MRGALRGWTGALLSVALTGCVIGGATVEVTVSPASATVDTGASLQLQATVTGTRNSQVRWSVEEGAAGGTISADGLYTAPANAGTFHVVATSEANSRESARATLTVTEPGSGGVQVSISPPTASLATGESRAFTATVTGTGQTGVIWTATGGAITQDGVYTAGSTPGNFTVTAISAADARRSASASIEIFEDGQSVVVALTPATAILEPGGQTRFTATVSGATDRTVTFSATCGTVNATGRYTAPSTPGSCQLTATSNADPTRSASASIQIVEQVRVEVAPSNVTLETGSAQTFTATVTGTAQLDVVWSATCGTITPSGHFVAPSTAGSCTVTASSVADPGVSDTAQVTVLAPTVAITLTPEEVTLQPGDSQTFVAIVTGALQTGVTWSATGGTITADGSYTAPGATGVYTVTATSVANAAAVATARVAVVSGAYELSGTITTTGEHLSQPIYIVVQTPEGATLGGTRIAGTGGSFTVRGLTATGPLDVWAFKDITGLYQDWYDPAAEAGGVTVTANGSNVTGVAVQLSAPPAATPTTPQAPRVIPGDGLLYVRPVHAGDAPRYRLYWGTSANPGPANSLGSVTLSGLNDYLIRGLTNGVTYHVAMRAVSWTGTEGASSPASTMQPGATPGGTRTISGEITASGITRTGPLYAVVIDGAQGHVHRIANVPSAVQVYSVPARATQVSLGFVLDQGNDGVLGPTDPGYFDGYAEADTTASNAPGTDLTLATGDVNVSVRSVLDVIAGAPAWSLDITVLAIAKMPARVELLSGFGVPSVRDLGKSFWFGEHATRVTLGGPPAAGDAYSLRVHFTDGSQQTLTGEVSAVVPVASSVVSITGAGTPVFRWSAPTSVPTVRYGYLLDIYDEDLAPLWSTSLPANATSVRYNFDGQAAAPTLTSGQEYSWYLYVMDEYGNYAVDAEGFIAP